MQLAISKEANRQSFLIVAGSDSPLKYRLLVKKLGIEKKIIFLGHVQNIQNVLSIIDVAVLPTFYDPSSRFILEALAAARPVITTKFNGAAESFIDRRHGRVIDRPENITAIAEALCYFADKNNIKKASEAIIADNLKEKISVARAAERLISLYDSIIGKRKKQLIVY